MARTIHAVILAALQAKVFSPLFLVEAEFDSGPLYLWNGLGDKVIAGKTYTGAGSLLSLSEAEETSQIVARGMSISLSGIPASLIALALQEPYQGRPCVVRLGIDGSEESAVLFSGLMDQMNIEESASSGFVTVLVENDLAALDRVISRLYSDQSHKSRHPTDDFFSHIVALGNKELQWGGGTNSENGAASAVDTIRFSENL